MKGGLRARAATLLQVKRRGLRLGALLRQARFRRR